MRKIICGIYKITSPSGKVYVGQSKDVYARWSVYKKLKCVKQPRLYNSFKKHSVERHKFEVIHECSREELNDLEKYYVDLFQTFNSKFGLNLKDGGGSRVKCSEEIKIKIGNANRGKKHSLESRKKISIAGKGRIVSEERRKKASQFFKGKKYNLGRKTSDETKEKLRQIGKIRIFTEEHRKNISLSQKGIPKKLTEASREKIRAARAKQVSPFKGKSHSEATKEKIRLKKKGQKMSESQRLRLINYMKLQPSRFTEWREKNKEKKLIKIKCDICKKEFSIDSLDSHNKSVTHINKLNRNLEWTNDVGCIICCKVFKLSNLKRHNTSLFHSINQGRKDRKYSKQLKNVTKITHERKNTTRN